MRPSNRWAHSYWRVLRELHSFRAGTIRSCADTAVFVVGLSQTGDVKTVYAVRLAGPRWSDDIGMRARSAVDQWVETEHPFSERGPGVTVRVDDEDPRRWWRYTIGETLGDGDIATTVVSMSTIDASTSFEVRLSVVPGGTRIRSGARTVSAAAVRELTRNVVDVGSFVDAGWRITTGARPLADEASAQEAAAFCDAPSRALPVIIETIPTNGISVFRSDRLPLTLTGLAHVLICSGDGSRIAFNEFFGEHLLLPQGMALIWPDHARQNWNGSGISSSGGDDVRKEIVGTVTAGAVQSFGPLRSPPFRRRQIESGTAGSPTRPESREPLEVDDHPAEVDWDEYRAALDGWQESEERITELEEALMEADRLIAEKQEVLERGDELRDRLVLQNTELAIRLGRNPSGLTATSALDAVQQATHICEHLTFHPRALESATTLDGIDASRLLNDLVRLNVVAGDWQSGRINNASLTISCRSMGLNYAAGISDTAQYKFGDDYAFTWRGRTEQAVAHIRNGRGTRLYRIHLFFDSESQQVVVAYIGRHLRGKYG